MMLGAELASAQASRQRPGPFRSFCWNGRAPRRVCGRRTRPRHQRHV